MTTADLNRFFAADRPWIADGGLETDLLFNEGIDLPDFASFHIFETTEGRVALDRYMTRYLELARDSGTGFVLDTATWRSGRFWAGLHPRGIDGLGAALREAADVARGFRMRHTGTGVPIVINGAVGPAGDGYAPDRLWSAEAAEEIHLWQMQIFAEEGVDMVSAVTMTHPAEAVGAVRAARSVGLPIAVSFVTETDGRLPTGQTLGDAIGVVEAETGHAPLFYMINCAHPDHFLDALQGGWLDRIGGVRANASRMSHAELDEAETLDDGDPQEFGRLYARIAARLPNLRLIGGCCGTDHRHVACAAHHLIARQAA